MKTAIQEKAFASLHLSKEEALNEMVFLSSSQKLAEFTEEASYFEKKYGLPYEDFNKMFTGKAATYEEENDWMSWKFAFEGAKCWKEIVQRLKDDN